MQCFGLKRESETRAPRPEWRRGKLGHKCTLGVLVLALFEESEPDEWELMIYLREGVTIGQHTKMDRLAKLRLTESSKFSAQMVAEAAAEKWFRENLERMLREQVGA